MRVLCHRLHVRHRGHFLMARAHHAARRKGAGRTGEKERLMEVHEELVGSVSTPQATPGSFVRPYSSATSCGSAGGSVVTGPPNDWSSTPESAHTLAASPL